jgi:hypothetical protein
MEQEPAKDPAMTGFQFIPHIHDVNGRETSEVFKDFGSLDTLGQIQYMDLICISKIPLLHPGRGGAEHAHRAAQSRVRLRRCHRVIERRLGLVIRRVVALVRDDEPDVRQGREQGTARADDNLECPRAGAPPRVVALALGKFGVHQPDLPGKTI